MPERKKKGAQSLEQQLENTQERMDEALDRLKTGELPPEEEHRVKEKTKHRREMIQGLEGKLEDSTIDEP